MRLLIEELWSATREGKPLARRAFFLWKLLCFLRYLYAAGLYLRSKALAYKAIPRVADNLPVIAVGNLTVGGTGKSVFVQWLIEHAGWHHPAVLLRGYKSAALKKESVFVVGDGRKIFGSAALVGDEPLQVAQRGVPVAIGKNRFEALTALQAIPSLFIDVVILDDGYQTQSIFKDFTILLVDARAPLGNGYLFPAGPVREHDYSRADIIIFTHADEVFFPAASLKERYFPAFPADHIFAGKHAFAGFINNKQKKVVLDAHTPVLLCSGIAKPENLEDTVKKVGMRVMGHCIFPDHHSYSLGDVEKLITTTQQLGVSFLVTTEKDWTKLQEYQALFAARGITSLIAKIEFEFLTSREYAVFVALLRRRLMQGGAAA